MKWLKQYIKLRRQNDVIKVLTVLFIICVFCIISSIVSGVSFYKKQNQQVAYSFQAASVTDELLEEIKENKYINIAAPMKKVAIQFLANGETKDFECVMISKEYLNNVMGIDDFQSNLFYVNKKAMDMIVMEKSQIAAKYVIQNEEEVLSYKNCQIVLLPDNREEEDTPIVYYCASSNELKDASEAIILLEKHDLDGSVIQYLSGKGFQLEESEAVVEDKAEMNETFLVIKYRIIILMMCMVTGWVLKKYAL